MSSETMSVHGSRVNKPPLKWISVAMWEECIQLSSQIPAFSGICHHIAVNQQFWLDFSKNKDPYVYLEPQEKGQEFGRYCKD